WDGGAVAAPEALAWSASGAATGPIVGVDLVLPPGERADTSTSGCEVQDFDAFPAGAVAVLQRGTCTFAHKAALAEAAGAVAAVVGNEGQRGREGPLLGSLDEDDPPGIPVVGVDHAAMVALLDVPVPVTVVVDGEVQVVPSENVLVDLPGRGPGT